MSSFDYTDNFNGFNDLINRADFLTEMKIGKAHPSFKGLAGRIQDDPRSGGKGFPRDARMLIKTVLFNVDIFKDEDLATLRASGVEASKEYREALEALFDKYEDEMIKRITDNLGEDTVKSLWNKHPNNITGYKNDVTWSFIELVAMSVVDSDEIYAIQA